MKPAIDPVLHAWLACNPSVPFPEQLRRANAKPSAEIEPLKEAA